MCVSPFRLPWSGSVDLATRKAVRFDVPCGQCIECRIHRSRHWALRCVHELRSHKHSSFLTLTYRDDDLVWGSQVPTLYPRHLQLFFKRLRKCFPDRKIRYFSCGEYGDRSGRPHYHVILFGIDFVGDRVLDSNASKPDYSMYRSALLNSLWSHGDCLIGDVTFDSIAYCARYTLKKITGKGSSFYSALDIEPEFSRMSRRPGLGADYFDKYYVDFFPNDFCLIPQSNVKLSVPSYYSRRFSKLNFSMYRDVVNSRVDRAGLPVSLERQSLTANRKVILSSKFDKFMRDFE